MRSGFITIPGRPSRGRIGTSVPVPIDDPPPTGQSWLRSNADVDPGAGSPIVYSMLGDSIAINQNADDQGPNPFDLMAPILAGLFPSRSVTPGTNQSHSGYSANYYLTGGISDYTAARAAFITSNTTHVILTLSPNAIRLGESVSTYKTSMQQVCADLISDGMTVVLCGFGGYQIGAPAGSDWTTLQSVELGDAMHDALLSLCNGTTILQGSFDTWRYFLMHYDQLRDGLHPSGNRQGIYSGTQNYANFWARGLYAAILENVDAVPQNPINNDGTLDLTKWKKYFESWTWKSWSKRLGQTHAEAYGNETDTRRTLYRPPNTYDNYRYDQFGTGDGPFVNNGDYHAGQTPTDLHLMTLDGQVVPHQYQFSPNGHGGNEPGVNNCFRSLPAGAVQFDYTVQYPGSSPNLWMDNPGDHSLYMIATTSPLRYQVAGGGDYWSDVSDSITIARNPFSDGGLAGGLSNAYYSLCYSIKPKHGYSPGDYNSDPTSQYATSFEPAFSRYGGIAARNSPFAQAYGYPSKRLIHSDRGYFTYCQEPVIIDRDGAMSSSPNGTGRVYYPQPTYLFPAHERPYKVSISTCCEFISVLVQDINLGKSKVVVFACQGYGQGGNGAVPYTGFANIGSWTYYHRLGEIVPNMKFATDVVSAADSQLHTGNLYQGFCFDDQGQRDGFRSESEITNSISFAKNGYIAITSEFEGKVEMWSMQPLLQKLWDSYLVHDQTAYQTTRDAMLARQFPPVWDASGQAGAPLDASLVPTLIGSWDLVNPDTSVREAPSALLASGYITGDHTGENFADMDKLLVGCRSGMVYMLNTSPIMDRYHFRSYWNQALGLWGTPFQVGRPGSNITQMIWSRLGNDNYYDFVASTGVMPVGAAPNSFLNIVHVCCRAERTIYSLCTRFDVEHTPYRTLGVVIRSMNDTSIADPVSIVYAWRNKVMRIADFWGMRDHSVLYDGLGRGAVNDPTDGSPYFPGWYSPPNPNDTSDPNAYGGATIYGSPSISVTANNVN